MRQLASVYQQIPMRDRKYALARQNIQQVAMEEKWQRTGAWAAKKKRIELAWTHIETASPSRHCNGHVKATDEEGNPGTPGKRSGEINVASGLQVQVEEDGGSSTRQNWIEWSCLWPVLGVTRHKSVFIKSCILFASCISLLIAEESVRR